MKDSIVDAMESFILFLYYQLSFLTSLIFYILHRPNA